MNKKITILIVVSVFVLCWFIMPRINIRIGFGNAYAEVPTARPKEHIMQEITAVFNASTAQASFEGEFSNAYAKIRAAEIIAESNKDLAKAIREFKKTAEDESFWRFNSGEKQSHDTGKR